LAEISRGKDTVTGHWEMMGVETRIPFPIYPDGFPPDILRPFEAAIGTETLGNYPASGTQIIQQLGEEHVRTGRPIVYTSADSVFQIAAHEDPSIFGLDRLYRACETARALLVPPHHGVGRVIARPFVGSGSGRLQAHGKPPRLSAAAAAPDRAGLAGRRGLSRSRHRRRLSGIQRAGHRHERADHQQSDHIAALPPNTPRRGAGRRGRLRVRRT
jgi:phosphopentomutase